MPPHLFLDAIRARFAMLASRGRCSFGYACYRKSCEYDHPLRERKPCQHGDGCFTAQCAFQHPASRRVCFYGSACRELKTGTCSRLHPPVAVVDGDARGSQCRPGARVTAPVQAVTLRGGVAVVPPPAVVDRGFRRPGFGSPSGPVRAVRGDGDVVAVADGGRGAVVTAERVVESAVTRRVKQRTNVGACLRGARCRVCVSASVWRVVAGGVEGVCVVV